MDGKKYIEAKDCTLEIYEEFRNEQKFTEKQSIDATFEESVIPMRKDESEYVSVFLNLAILSLKQKFIPDYIFDRVEKIKNIDLKDLSSDDLSCYKADLNNFDNLISQGDFEIDSDEIYSLRVNMLLGE
ncbi:hypothetical protein IW492_17410 [Enterococcus sp. BWB1-3]|uniref:hypothetical protein n=1 Tax=Enterococcus sp. BWB1-3 TaxID=2787713 RepID=UPI001922D8D1|nr:hypothetical protein [Enterococcus sp. BWB1-3]MBL1231005.1 hypothetical protein [Enterococcus sp. BWB1-3]